MALFGIRRRMLRGPSHPNVRLSATAGVYVTPDDLSAVQSAFLVGADLPLYDGDDWLTVDNTEPQIRLTDTQEVTRTNGSNVLSGVDTSQLIPAMMVSGEGINATATISQVDPAGPNTIAMAASEGSPNATGSGPTIVTFKLPPLSVVDIFAERIGRVPVLSMRLWSTLLARASALTVLNGLTVLASDSKKIALGSVGIVTAGQTGDAATLRGISNRYNPMPGRILVYDVEPTWDVPTGSDWRQVRANAANQAWIMCCDDSISLELDHVLSGHSASGPAAGWAGIGNIATTNLAEITPYGGFVVAPFTAARAHYRGAPGAGFRPWLMLEKGDPSQVITMRGYGTGDANTMPGLYGWTLR